MARARFRTRADLPSLGLGLKARHDYPVLVTISPEAGREGAVLERPPTQRNPGRPAVTRQDPWLDRDFVAQIG